MNNTQTINGVNKMDKTNMRLAMMEGYVFMAKINLEEANLAPHTFNDGMELYEDVK